MAPKPAATVKSARSLWSCALGSCPLAPLAVALVLAPGPLAAQGAVRANPHVGLWVPLGVVHEETVNGRLVQRSQIGDLLVGARVGLRVARGLAVEGSLGLSPGLVARTDSSGTTDLPGLALLATVRLTGRPRLSRDFDGLVGIGVGVVRRSGEGWDGTHVTRAFVGALGVQMDLVPGSAFRTEVEFYASRGRRTTLGSDTRAPWRGDLVLSFGIVLPAPRRR